MVPLPLVLPRCEQIADRISEYLDGELAEPAAERVAIHLALCAGCARSAAQLARLVGALHRLPRARGKAPGDAVH